MHGINIAAGSVHNDQECVHKSGEETRWLGKSEAGVGAPPSRSVNTRSRHSSPPPLQLEKSQ